MINGERHQSYVNYLYKTIKGDRADVRRFCTMLRTIMHEEKQFDSIDSVRKYINSAGVIESTRKMTLEDIELGKTSALASLNLADLEIHGEDNENLYNYSLDLKSYTRRYRDSFNEADTESERIALAIIIFMEEFSSGQSVRERDKFREVVSEFPFESFLGKLTIVSKPRIRKNQAPV